MELDADNSGVVVFSEILESLFVPAEPDKDKGKAIAGVMRQAKTTKAEELKAMHSVNTKKFLMAVAWSFNDDETSGAGVIQRRSSMGEIDGDQLAQLGSLEGGIDVSQWTVDATDAPGLIGQLRMHMNKSKVSVADVVELFNYEENDAAKRSADGFYDITQAEFIRALRQRLGYSGPVSAIKGAFELIGGSDGKIDVDELFQFVTGRANNMTMKQATATCLDNVSIDTPLDLHLETDDDEPWAVADLRRALQGMLIQHAISPSTLLNAWDVDGDHQLSRSELLTRMKKLVVSTDGERQDMWYERVRPTVTKCFRQMAGKKPCIDLSAFGAFLNKDWPGLEDSSHGSSHQSTQSTPTVHSGKMRMRREASFSTEHVRREVSKAKKASCRAEALASPEGSALLESSPPLSPSSPMSPTSPTAISPTTAAVVQASRARRVTITGALETKTQADRDEVLSEGFIDMATPARRFVNNEDLPAILEHRKQIPVPLYDGKLPCVPSYSRRRPVKNRPASRAIWAGSAVEEWTLPAVPRGPRVADLARSPCPPVDESAASPRATPEYTWAPAIPKDVLRAFTLRASASLPTIHVVSAPSPRGKGHIKEKVGELSKRYGVSVCDVASKSHR